MTRQRMYVDQSVVDAARTRLEHVYDVFGENLFVQFSGGKDSTALLYLMKEFHEKHRLGPVKVIFRDEEMVSPAVARYVEEVRNYDWVDMTWLCLPQGQEVWVLGRREYVLLWSPMRAEEGRLVREMPPWAMRAEDFGLDPSKPIPDAVDVYSLASVNAKGMTAFLTGVRANESMVRYRSCVQKLHEPYIVQPYKLRKSIPLKFVRPIYDWTTDDVVKYVTEEHGARFCEFYDLASMTGANPRVGIPLHSVAVRRISDVVTTEPEFYDQLVRCFPHIDAQRRYWGDFDIEKLIAGYAERGWDGISDLIAENMLTPGIKKRAQAFSAEFRAKHTNDPYSYPLSWLARVLLLNDFFSTAVTPVGPGTKADAIRRAQAEADANALDAMDDVRPSMTIEE